MKSRFLILSWTMARLNILKFNITTSGKIWSKAIDNLADNNFTKPPPVTNTNISWRLSTLAKALLLHARGSDELCPEPGFYLL